MFRTSLLFSILCGLLLLPIGPHQVSGVRSVEDLHPCLVPLLLSTQKEAAKLEIPLGRCVDALELFSGKRAITRHTIKKGWVALSFDKLDGENILTAKGYQLAMEKVMSLRIGGCLWAAPECSSWVWISRSGSGRSKDKATGNAKLSRIDEANIMVSRLTNLLLLAWSRGAHIFVEQPVSSVMNFFSPMSYFIASCLLFSTITWLGAFGAETSKPINVWSTCAAVKSLKKSIPRGLKRLCTKKQGRTYGKTDDLTESSAYPEKFGRAVANLYSELLNTSDHDVLFEHELVEMLVPSKELKKPKKRRKR